MEERYSLEDVARSYRWLGHKGFTELNAYHPDYRPGRENVEWNAKHDAFPKIWHAKTEEQVIRFVVKNAPARMVCYGLNPRQRILRDGRGNARSATENEIEVSQSMVLDLDLVPKNITYAHQRAFEAFLYRANDYFRDRGTQVPARAFTGRGYHLLFAYPAIEVKEHPDIAARLNQFCDNFRQAFKQELDRLEARLDSTQDLRRCVKVYGTAKPEVGIVSLFYGKERIEDHALRRHLLAIKLSERSEQHFIALKPMEAPPNWLEKVLESENSIRELWLGKGKPATTDTSRSGYDFSLVKSLMRMGYRNIDELATILSLRPEGAVKNSGKGEQYIRRTIANAILD